MGAAKMLVVEDDQDFRDALSTSLKAEGYELRVCGTADEALTIAKSFTPDLILLDIGLPDKSGFEVCRAIRKTKQSDSVPIVMLSGRDSETEIVHGLEVGADDYITKPCTPSILTARLRAILRRQPKAKVCEENTTRIHGLEIDSNRHRVAIGGNEIKLTPSEFKILQFLVTRPGWVFTRSQIVAAIKQQDFAISERSIDVQMFSLRKRLGDLQDIIETVRGVGYKIKEEV
jgi:two-component system, OmpR family, alkaline phosphatase synthesis response regulator PhoP